MAAFAAWLSGDGYRARITLEHAERLDPHYTMAHLIRATLDMQMNPTTWTPMDIADLDPQINTLFPT